MKKVGIINYSAGNIASIINAINHLDFLPVVIDKPENNFHFYHIILPGVGNFGRLANNLLNLGFHDYLDKNKKKGNMILGICVGMQLLFTSSDESKNTNGLNFFNGNFKLFNGNSSNFPVPHVGFNNVKHFGSKIWKNIQSESNFYFIHSYKLDKVSEKCDFSVTNYGEDFVSCIEKENVIGCQFHPEKSHKPGLKFINNFLSQN